MAKVYVFMANGFEDVEALIPIDVLRRGGVDVITVSTTEDLIGCCRQEDRRHLCLSGCRSGPAWSPRRQEGYLLSWFRKDVGNGRLYRCARHRRW